MLEIGGKSVDTLYVGSKLVKQVYVGSKNVYPDEEVIPKQIRDAMVLWYDIKKQGATNESMAENPVLVDHSGNGHDATCYNFAWTEESGISTTNYPNALVSDGVDDYALVNGLPNIHSLLINTDYTSLSNLTGRWKYLYDSVMSGSETDRWYAALNADNVLSYNPILKDEYAERENNIEGIRRFNLFSHNNLNGDFGLMIFYSLILFNRTLTTEEIDWVKTNLMD